MYSELIKSLSNALNDYQKIINTTKDKEKTQDYTALANITERLIESMENDDTNKIKVGLLSFSRQASDSYSEQPSEFKELSKNINKIKKLVM